MHSSFPPPPLLLHPFMLLTSIWRTASHQFTPCNWNLMGWEWNEVNSLSCVLLCKPLTRVCGGTESWNWIESAFIESETLLRVGVRDISAGLFANLLFPRFVCRKRSCVQVATTRQGCWFGFPDIPRRELLAYVTNTKYTVTNTGFCSGASVSKWNGGESNGPLISVYKAYYLRYFNGWWGGASVCLCPNEVCCEYD